MMKTIRVITTVGTSMFTNYMDSKVEKAFKDNNEDYESIKKDFDKVDMSFEQYDEKPDRINI